MCASPCDKRSANQVTLCKTMETDVTLDLLMIGNISARHQQSCLQPMLDIANAFAFNTMKL